LSVAEMSASTLRSSATFAGPQPFHDGVRSVTALRAAACMRHLPEREEVRFISGAEGIVLGHGPCVGGHVTGLKFANGVRGKHFGGWIGGAAFAGSGGGGNFAYKLQIGGMLGKLNGSKRRLDEYDTRRGPLLGCSQDCGVACVFVASKCRCARGAHDLARAVLEPFGPSSLVSRCLWDVYKFQFFAKEREL